MAKYSTDRDVIVDGVVYHSSKGIVEIPDNVTVNLPKVQEGVYDSRAESVENTKAKKRGGR